jgi:hypothetical protein
MLKLPSALLSFIRQLAAQRTTSTVQDTLTSSTQAAAPQCVACVAHKHANTPCCLKAASTTAPCRKADLAKTSTQQLQRKPPPLQLSFYRQHNCQHAHQPTNKTAPTTEGQTATTPAVLLGLQGEMAPLHTTITIHTYCNQALGNNSCLWQLSCAGRARTHR